MQPQQTPNDPNQPVAYAADGTPLYAAPQTGNAAQPTTTPQQVVHVTRSPEPVAMEVSEETQRRHEESKRRFPRLNLSEHEYVISVVKRHPIGMVPAILAGGIVLTAMFLLALNYPALAETMALPEDGYGWMLLVSVMTGLLAVIGTYLAVWVYVNNYFFLTNESVIQEIQMSVFSRREQTVSLANIEDASFLQSGIIQSLLNYGSIRLSTEGDETTYRFEYVANPKGEIATLNNAVEAFKNGRPIEDN